MPDAGRTHGPPATKNAGGSHHRSSRYNRHSLGNGFNGCSALSPESGLVSLRRPGIIIQGLMPASGHQDHTALPSASGRARLCSQKRPSHPAPHVRDDRDTPLRRVQDGGDLHLIRTSEKEKYFSRRGLTRIRKISPSGKSVQRSGERYGSRTTFDCFVTGTTRRIGREF
jgi:hypothetical protein